LILVIDEARGAEVRRVGNGTFEAVSASAHCDPPVFAITEDYWISP